MNSSVSNQILSGTNLPNNHPAHHPGNNLTPRFFAGNVFTSAERRLPYYHRFNAIPNQAPPPNLVRAYGPRLKHKPQPQPQRSARHQSPPQLTIPKTSPLKQTMSSYEINPVGALQERFHSQGEGPVFVMTQSEGMSHCPIFTFQASVAGKTASGSGNSKKQAKHKAARALLDALDNREPSRVSSLGSNCTQPLLPTAHSPQPIAKMPTSSEALILKHDNVPLVKSDNGKEIVATNINSIGQLQEHCVKTGLPMPTYSLEGSEGQPHLRCFVMSVKVGSLSVSGESSTKKDAKKIAALKMLNLIINGSGDVKSKIFLSGNVENSLKSQNMPTSLETATEEKCNRPNILKDFKCELPEAVALRQTHLSRKVNLICLTLLIELSKEQQFEFSFIDLEEKTDEEDCQCMLELATQPTIVFFGTGKTILDANNTAARVALNYLKVKLAQTAPDVGNGIDVFTPSSGNQTNKRRQQKFTPKPFSSH